MVGRGYLDVHNPLLTLPEAAAILGLSEQRVYQLDDVLEPVKQARGAKTVTRYYEPAVVERVRSERAADATKPPPRERLVVSRLVAAASRAGLAVGVSVADAGTLSAGACVFCGEPGETRHDIIRLDAAGAFSRENLAPCCRTCLDMKGDGDALEYIQHVLRVARHSCGLDVGDDVTPRT